MDTDLIGAEVPLGDRRARSHANRLKDDPVGVARARAPLPGFYLLCVLWGRDFARMFADITVSSLLSPNNIPAIHNKEESRLVICATPEDWAYLDPLPIFAELRLHMRAHFLDIGDRYFYNKYHKMAFGHRQCTDFAFKQKKIAIHINPDTLVPDGSIAAVQRLADDGVNLVLCPAVRFNQDGIMAELTERGVVTPNRPIVLPMREAVDIGIRHMHIETRAGNWDADNFGQLHPQHMVDHFPICCYLKVPSENGIVMCGHNWAPFMMNYASLKEHRAKSLEYWTIDGSYAFENFAEQELGTQIHVVRDSDELFLLGMTPANEMNFVPQPRWWKRAPVVGAWNKGYELNGVIHVKWMDDFRRKIYPLFARWHVADLNSKWAETERRAAAIVAEYAGESLLPSRTLAGLKTPADWWRFVFSYRLPRVIWYALFFRGKPAIALGVTKRRIRPNQLVENMFLVLGAFRADPRAWGRIGRGLRKVVFKEPA